MITTTTTLYAIYKNMQSEWLQMYCYQGRIQDFKLRGGALKKIAPSGWRRDSFWGKSPFYAKKSYLFPILGGGYN